LKKLNLDNRKHLLRVTPWFIIFILLVSCASAPRVTLPEQENRELSILPAGARVYLWADVVQGRPLLDAISSFYFTGEGVSDILDTTHSAAVAIFSAEQAQSQGRRFFLAAIGSFPRNRANLALGFNRSWRRQRSVTGSTFWYSESNNIALTLGSNLALVSDADPYEEFVFEIPPPGFVEFNRGHALAGWVNEPSDFINNFLSSMGIPLQVPAENLFFGATSLPDAVSSMAGWDLLFRINTAPPAQARSLLTLFSMARLFTMQGPQIPFAEDPVSISPQEAARLLFANTPTQDESALILRVGPLDEGTIALLFEMFSIYSN